MKGPQRRRWYFAVLWRDTLDCGVLRIRRAISRHYAVEELRTFGRVPALGGWRHFQIVGGPFESQGTAQGFCRSYHKRLALMNDADFPIRRNPPMRVTEIRYQRFGPGTTKSSRGPYKHAFKGALLIPRLDNPRHPLSPPPRDLARRCPRSGLRYFEQPEVREAGIREVGDKVACPGCQRLVRLRETRWRVALIPRHAIPR